MKLLIHVLFLLVAIECYPNEGSLFEPLVANPFEARIGTIYQFEDDKLRLDIGNSFDLMQIDYNPELSMSFGGDFFTFTRLRSVGRFKFPVETTDYYFGLNTKILFYLNGIKFQSRIRLAHISSHLIDGYTKDWEFIKQPYVYSREFLDIVLAHNLFKELRLYIGSNLVFSKIPDLLGWYEFQSGFEYEKSLNKLFSIKGAYDFKLKSIDEVYFGQNALQIGLKTNLMNDKGIYLAYYYYAGKSIHGLFYNDYDRYNSIGIQIYY